MPLKSLPVLMYHHVSDVPGLVTISPSTFCLQMESLKKGGWKTLSLMEVEAFFNGVPTPEKSALITFDDGYADNYLHAFPTLEALDLRATIFLITSLIKNVEVEREAPLPDHRRAKGMMKGDHPEEAMLTWPEIARMRKSGLIDFASHTHAHRRWNEEISDPAARRRAIRDDLSSSASMLETRLGAPCRHLCWPWGEYDEERIALARESGFQYLYTVERGVNLPQETPDRIKRFVVKEKNERWLQGQLMIYSRPLIGKIYTFLRGAA